MSAERICRGIAGFIVSPALAAVLYTLVATGTEFELYLLPFTLGAAYAITALIMIPLFLLLIFKDWYSWRTSVVVPGLALGLFFLILSYFSYQGYTILRASGSLLVEGGSLTSEGWANLLLDSAFMAAIGCFSGAVFYVLYDFRFHRANSAPDSAK